MEILRYFDFFYLFNEQFTILLIITMILGVITKQIKLKIFNKLSLRKDRIDNNEDGINQEKDNLINENDKNQTNDENIEEEDLEEKDIKMIFVFIMDEKPSQNFLCENTTNLSLSKNFND